MHTAFPQSVPVVFRFLMNLGSNCAACGSGMYRIQSFFDALARAAARTDGLPASTVRMVSYTLRLSSGTAKSPILRLHAKAPRRKMHGCSAGHLLYIGPLRRGCAFLCLPPTSQKLRARSSFAAAYASRAIQAAGSRILTYFCLHIHSAPHFPWCACPWRVEPALRSRNQKDASSPGKGMRQRSAPYICARPKPPLPRRFRRQRCCPVRAHLLPRATASDRGNTSPVRCSRQTARPG